MNLRESMKKKINPSLSSDDSVSINMSVSMSRNVNMIPSEENE